MTTTIARELVTAEPDTLNTTSLQRLLYFRLRKTGMKKPTPVRYGLFSDVAN
jgi:hypothetical protein